MLKVLYWVSTDAHRRVCLSMDEHDDVVQAIVLPTSVSTDGLKIKNIYKYKHTNLDGVVGVIDKFKPDVFIQYTSSRYFVNQIKKRNIKHGFSAHGVWPDKSYNNRIIVADQFFQNFDLFLGANHGFEHTLRTYAKTKAVIAIDTLTQFDVLYDSMKDSKKIRESLLKGSGSTKIITLFGHKLSTKTDNLSPYDYGYYRAIVELAGLAKKNDWMVFVKPKGNKDRSYINGSNKKWVNLDGVRKKYLGLSSNKNIKFLPHDADPYKYLCSDVIITSARSTIEVEAALVKKPIIRIWVPKPKPNERQLSYEYGALDFDADYLIKNMADLEGKIISAFGNNNELNKNQEKLVNHHGITFDGRAHIRFLDAIRKTVGSKK